MQDWLADDGWIEGAAVGMWQANCYLVGDHRTGTCVVVDPGQDAAAVVQERLDARQSRCEAILLTHGHLDHLWSAPALARELGVPVFLHPDDRWLWDDPAAGIGASMDVLRMQTGFEWEPEDDVLEPIRDGQRLSAGGIGIEVKHTPGHTPGSCVFLLAPAAGERVLLSGDLLFAGSVGRTDFPGGSWEQQQRSLAAQVLVLDDATHVGPGHGPATTVGAERASNPFLQDLQPLPPHN